MAGAPQDSPQVIRLPEETARALSALNFVVTRKAVPDTSLLQGWTAANAAENVRSALEGRVPNVSEEQVQQYVRALIPAVEALAGEGAPSEQPAAAAGSDCPVDVGSIFARAVEQAQAASVPDAASTAAAPSAPAPAESCPMDIRGMFERAIAAFSPTPAPAAASPAAASAPRGPGAMPSLPARPTRPSLGSRPAGAAPAGGSAAPAGAAPAGAAGATAGAVAPAAAAEEDPNESPEVAALRKKVQDIRVMLFRLAKRLDQNLRGSIVNQVEYRLSLAERIRLTNARSNAVRRASPFDAAREKAEALEEAEPEGDLNFKCTVMLLGMSGVGKSATINSLLGDNVVGTNAFEPETRRVRVVSGNVKGVQMRFIDTPGLMPSASMTGKNQRILSQAKAAWKKYKPDIVLYLDRMDFVRRDFGDLPLLRSITEMFGASMWFNTIVVLTHASTAPPEGPNGQISYDMYANHRSHILQQTIRQAAGDMRLLNPVTYAENHPNCRKNRDGHAVLPNGVMWQQNLLLYVFSSKILADTENVLKIQSTTSQMAQMGGQKIPPLPYLLSNMIQSKTPRKAPDDEREIKSLEELNALPDDERKEEMRKRKEYEKMRAEEAKADAESKTQVAVPAPDPALQPTFDSDSNGHYYRFLEAAGGWVVRPFVEAHGVDHDDGVEGFSCEKGTMLRPRDQYLGGVPTNVMAQLQKDKNNFSVNGEAEASVYHRRNIISTAAAEVQTIGGKDMVYTSRLETRIKNHARNKTAAGVTVSRLAENNLPLKGPVAVGFKAEDRLKIMKGLKAILSGGMMSTKTRMGRETAKAANAEVRMKAGDNAQHQITVGGSAMHWRRDLLLGGNVSVQTPLTEETVMTARSNLNSKGTGQVAIRLTSHDHPALGYSLLVPIVGALYDKIFRGEVY
eukprot:jgi/Tetstr1/448607/TSEL_035856.t1